MECGVSKEKSFNLQPELPVSKFQLKKLFRPEVRDLAVEHIRQHDLVFVVLRDIIGKDGRIFETYLELFVADLVSEMLFAVKPRGSDGPIPVSFLAFLLFEMIFIFRLRGDDHTFVHGAIPRSVQLPADPAVFGTCAEDQRDDAQNKESFSHLDMNFLTKLRN